MTNEAFDQILQSLKKARAEYENLNSKHIWPEIQGSLARTWFLEADFILNKVANNNSLKAKVIKIKTVDYLKEMYENLEKSLKYF